MKKQVLISVITLIPVVSLAKVSDFNAMISENMKEQTQLHDTVKSNVNEARGVADGRERVVIVEKTTASYNSPTRKDLLAFKKEKKNYQPSEHKQFERLANEIHSSNE
ncbi:MAG TPA: hypothetical protein VN132_12180 [Bdellovibrio sp.]|nr:hypothetical protein [Bdellovibrio sp.]